MKKIKILLKCILFFLLMCGINEFFRYLLIDDTNSYTRIMMHELYHQEENIDVLFLGSSHCYRSLNPQITDALFDTNTFNAGSSLQGLDGTYALLKEAGKYNDLKKVYVELYYGIPLETFSTRNDLTAVYLISDYMRPSLSRMQLLLKAGSSEHLFNSFVLGRREWEKLFDFSYIAELNEKKRSASYMHYDYITATTDAYLGKGYVESSEIWGESSNYARSVNFAFNENYISEDCKNYLKKIINYCQKNDIELAFFSAPMSDFSLASFGNYDFYIQQVNEFLSEYDIAYYDFNLCKNEILDITGNDLMDSSHLNGNGAEKFSTVFSEFFTGKLDSNIFYESFNDKLCNLDSPLIGYVMTTLDEFSNEAKAEDKYFDFENYEYVSINPVTYQSVTFEYRISKEVTNSSEPLLFQDWNENNLIYYPKNETGKFYIESRVAGTDEVINVTIFKY